MSVFVLIHGAEHGGWAWDKVTPLLKKEGHSVEAPDLPGHGKDKTPITEITLKAWTDRVCQVLDAQSEPVILAGHSMGGVVITQTAEYRPEKIKKLVYISAVLPQNGESGLSVMEGDPEGLVAPNLEMAEDQSYVKVNLEAVKEVFYHDCSDEDVEHAKQLLVRQAVTPLATPVETTPKNFGGIPRIFISCLQDRALTPALHKKMYTNLPCEKVITMDTSHSPFFAAPEELAKHLQSI